MDIKYRIEQLTAYAMRKGMLDPLDAVYARNALLALFREDAPYAGELRPEDVPNEPFETLAAMIDHAVGIGILPNASATQRDLLDAHIMGLLLPRPSETVRRFRDIAEAHSIEQATDDFYRMSIDSNYIRMDRIRKNESWIARTPYGELEITINLTKPEKDPKEIEAERNAPKSDYPQCLLCLDNVGYAGRLNHPARQNLRVIPLELQEERWYLQYSPYVYYNEHCIVFSEEHVPMRITDRTFRMLFDCLDRLPHYFIGSNADLPIVGGSILQHNHFQGGRHTFAMERAPGIGRFCHPEAPGVSMTIVRWPLSVIRLASADRSELEALAERILAAWQGYSDEERGIAAYSDQGGTRTPHNTITPIARRNPEGEYELDLVLRNNRTDDEHPYGIFHPPAHLHHIKKENIGLIEVLGLAILPDRLLTETEAIVRRFAEGRRDCDDIRQSPDHMLHKHAAWMEELAAASAGIERDEAGWRAYIREQIGVKFVQVLEASGVYKQTEHGLDGFRRFVASVGFVEA